MPQPANIDPPDDQPPVLGNWKNVYLFVLVLHLVIIFLFYLFGEAYA